MRLLAGAAAVVAMFWLGASLLVSWYIYDRSELYRWTWVPAALPVAPRRWMNLQVGLDESSTALCRLFPRSEGVVADFFDPVEMTEPSMSLLLHLQIAGVLQLLLALAHLDFVRRFGSRQELARVSLLTRQVLWVHTGFIMLVLVLFAGLTLRCADVLVEGGPLARAVLSGLAVFWVARWFCQFFVYRPELWRGNRRNTAVHVFFALLWTYLAGGYAIAFARQM